MAKARAISRVLLVVVVVAIILIAGFAVSLNATFNTTRTMTSSYSVSSSAHTTSTSTVSTTNTTLQEQQNYPLSLVSSKLTYASCLSFVPGWGLQLAWYNDSNETVNFSIVILNMTVVYRIYNQSTPPTTVTNASYNATICNSISGYTQGIDPANSNAGWSVAIIIGLDPNASIASVNGMVTEVGLNPNAILMNVNGTVVATDPTTQEALSPISTFSASGNVTCSGCPSIFLTST